MRTPLCPWLVFSFILRRKSATARARGAKSAGLGVPSGREAKGFGSVWCFQFNIGREVGEGGGGCGNVGGLGVALQMEAIVADRRAAAGRGRENGFKARVAFELYDVVDERGRETFSRFRLA